ncbi:hypothetical protein [Spongiactinospora sp. TRM90649]|uniref:TolB family protein n=1 Tax=Spongiactinospora sp. TRM90649 TaxID=3031114 RepID=UPI0023F6A211|nr:hypothetical protein [Spongiactinospora sp. TRM90649]MDF5753054.1 hypothetical protein [Spongiactinospora sp. TRM90649]
MREHIERDLTERDLTELLTVMADRAPVPDGDLVTLVRERGESRTRRRRRALAALAAVMAVTAIVGGGTALSGRLFPHGGGEERAAAIAARPGTGDGTASGFRGQATSEVALRPGLPAQAAVPVAADVWPEAVSTIPAMAADGWRYRPVTALSPTEILLSAESDFEKAGRLEIYDTASSRTTILGEMSAPAGIPGYYAQAVDIGPTHFAWWGTTPNDDTAWADIWVMPREGGEATRVTLVKGASAGIVRIGSNAEHVFWSTEGGDLYRVPITGGEPERVPSGDGLIIYSWPWAHRDGETLVNLETGEVRVPRLTTGLTSLRCGLEWCAGEDTAGNFTSLRPDGTGRQDLGGVLRPGTLASQVGYAGDIYGRFAQVGYGGSAIYDMATGKLAYLGPAGKMGRMGAARGVSSAVTAIYYWTVEPPAPAPCDTMATARCQSGKWDSAKLIDVLNLKAIR